jgi:multiple sugar transport system permease protein
VPSQVTGENYTQGWDALKHSFGYYLWNSAVITSLAVVGNLFACSLAAYAFARLEFPLKKLWFAIMLGSIMLPHPRHGRPAVHHVQQARPDQHDLADRRAQVPRHGRVLHLPDGAVHPHSPRELDEAASIDGAGHLRIFGQVIMPLCVPALATTAIFTFIWTWNDFFTQNLYLTNSDKLTVPVALRQFMDSGGDSSWGPLFAMSIISLGPIFGFFLAGQKYLVRGMATTGLK